MKRVNSFMKFTSQRVLWRQPSWKSACLTHRKPQHQHRITLGHSDTSVIPENRALKAGGPKVQGHYQSNDSLDYMKLGLRKNGGGKD